MQVIDRTESYLSRFIQAGNRIEYENSFPKLFEHYYHYWAKSESDIAVVTREDIETRKRWINKFIEKLTETLDKLDIDTNDIGFVYFIGVDTTNGHAFKYQDKFYVWLPLETYTTEKRVKVFITHELVHALQYHHSPSFYFGTKAGQRRLARQLISEGLATYLTRELLGISDLQSLWADYLDEADAQSWLQTCQGEEARLFNLIRENYYKNDHDLEIFYAADPDDIYRFRSGYYAGLKLIRCYAEKNGLSAKQLLNLSQDKFASEILNLIQSEMSGS